MDFDFNNPPCPYGYPLRMIDRVHSFDAAAALLVASKAVSRNEPLIQGHFPIFPILPGILETETVTQAASLLVNAIHGNSPPKRMVVAESRIRHFKPVYPGDVMMVEVRLIARADSSTFTVRSRISVGGEEAAKGQVTVEWLDDRKRRLSGAKD